MRHPLLWINDPGMATLAERTRWSTLYHITDDWLAADRQAAELERIAGTEAALMRLARVVVVCSPELVRRKQAVREGRPFPNAVDAAAYRRRMPRPSDLPHGPVALYLGTLHPGSHRCRALRRDCTRDRAGCLARARRPERARRRGDEEVLRLAGARLLGPRSREEVIGYLQHADVLVVPHVVTTFTDSVDPIKLYEYQAVGGPSCRPRSPGSATSTTHESRSRAAASSWLPLLRRCRQVALSRTCRRAGRRLERTGGGDGRASGRGGNDGPESIHVSCAGRGSTTLGFGTRTDA